SEHGGQARAALALPTLPDRRTDIPGRSNTGPNAIPTTSRCMKEVAVWGPRTANGFRRDDGYLRCRQAQALATSVPAAAGERHPSAAGGEKSMKRFAVLLAVALAVPAGGCMMKPRHLVYPDGVTFVGWHVPNFESCLWTRDPN